MFDSLDEQIKKDDKASISSTEKWTRYSVIALVSVVIFGALLYAASALS